MSNILIARIPLVDLGIDMITVEGLKHLVSRGMINITNRIVLVSRNCIFVLV
jgi:hypothetical protein